MGQGSFHRALGKEPPTTCCCLTICPCCQCCSLPPGKSVLFLGRRGSGKTHTFFTLMGASATKLQALLTPTTAFNSETVTFKRKQSYEFYDTSGALQNRGFWKHFYDNIEFDYVVYFIDPNPKSNKGKGEMYIEDRMELHTLCWEKELRNTKIILFLNWKQQEEDEEYDVVYRANRLLELKHDLALADIPKIQMTTENRRKRAPKGNGKGDGANGEELANMVDRVTVVGELKSLLKELGIQSFETISAEIAANH